MHSASHSRRNYASRKSRGNARARAAIQLGKLIERKKEKRKKRKKERYRYYYEMKKLPLGGPIIRAVRLFTDDENIFNYRGTGASL